LVAIVNICSIKHSQIYNISIGIPLSNYRSKAGVRNILGPTPILDTDDNEIQNTHT